MRRKAVTQIIDTLLAAGLKVRIEVTGRSMLPFLRPHDVVTLAPRAKRHTPGDLVAYRDSTGLVIHRLTHRTRHRYHTRGDGLSIADRPIHPHQVVAQVVALERRGRQQRLGSRLERRLLAVASRLGLLWRLRSLAPQSLLAQRTLPSTS